MEDNLFEAAEKKQRKPKTELESKSFKDGAIYLFKRADYKKPTWFCRVKVPGAKGYVSQSTKTTDEHAAYKFADDLFHKALVAVASGQDLKSKKVAAAIDEFIAYLEQAEKGRSHLTLKTQFLKRTKSFFETSRVKEINTKKLSDLNEWLRLNSRNQTLAPTSLKRYTANLKQFLGWCVERSYIDAVPASPKLKAPPNRRPHFDRSDYAKLTRHLREHVKAGEYPWVVRDRTMLVNYVLILANTGIRVGEARKLRWADIKEIPLAKGSNQEPHIALFVSGKTGPREVVARTSDVKIYFKRILQLRTNELGKKPDDSEFVFCNRDGTSVGSFKKSFVNLLKSAGVEYDSEGNRRTIYSLRHTYATFRLQDGVHQFVLAKNMGTSVAMLEKHYGHTSNVASAAELTKSGNFKGGKKTKAVDWLMEN
jgi:integrase